MILSFEGAHARVDSLNAFSCLAGINNGGKGLGLQCEHFTENPRISLNLSVLFCFGLVEKGIGRTANPDGKDQHALMTFVTPGLRYYFKGPNGTCRYALGCNLLIGHGQGASKLYTNGTNELQQRRITGFAVTNGIFIQLDKNIRIGAELALGLGSDDGLNSAAGAGTNPLGQLTVTAGYRKFSVWLGAPKNQKPVE